MVAENDFRHLSQADLQQVMIICEQLHHADPGSSFIEHCHNALDQAFAYIHHATEIYTLDPFALADLVNPTINGHWLGVFNQYVKDHPYVERMLGPAPNHLGAIQQEPTLGEFKKTALYNEFYEKVQGQNILWFAYRDGNELLSCAYLREQEFSDRELAMTRLIHPHIQTSWKNWKNQRALKNELDLLKGAVFQSEEEEAETALIRKALDALTARRRDVVELVADGKDNQQISEELGISVLTVKKHLQAIFLALDVQHRTALAAQWHKAYSIPLT